LSASYKVIVVGCGNVATTRHIPLWKAIPGVSIECAVDRDMNRAKSVSRRYNIPKYCETFEYALEKCDATIVDICTPVKTHFELAKKALLAGKHTLVEKPLTLSVDEAESLIAMAEKHNLVLMTAHSAKFYPSIRILQKILPEIGHLVSADVEVRYPNLPVWCQEQGGALYEVATHAIYLLDYLLGSVNFQYAFPLDETSPPRNLVLYLKHNHVSCRIAIFEGGNRFRIQFTGERATCYTPHIAFFLPRIVARGDSLGDIVADEFLGILNVGSSFAYLLSLVMRGIKKLYPHYWLFNAFIRKIKGESWRKEGEEVLRTIAVLERARKILEK
jgi:predicted dehydrogenase